MSVESDVRATPVATGNPVLIGLTGFLPAGLTLGLWLVGYLPATGLGGMVPAVWGSAGIFLLVAAIWAGRIGGSAVAAILGSFGHSG